MQKLNLQCIFNHFIKNYYDLRTRLPPWCLHTQYIDCMTAALITEWFETYLPFACTSGETCANYKTMFLSPLRVVALLCCFTSTIAATKSLSYQVKTDLNGIRVCSINKPSSVSTTYSETMCGSSCTLSSTCLYYQFKSDIKQCEIFDYLPKNFSVINQCNGYITQTSKLTVNSFFYRYH
jgi:hypothetical protein